MSLLWFLAIGLVSGWLAGQIMEGHGYGLLGNLVVGVVGALLGGYIFGLLGYASGGLIGQVVTAVVGAVGLLGVVSLVRKV